MLASGETSGRPGRATTAKFCELSVTSIQRRALYAYDRCPRPGPPVTKETSLINLSWPARWPPSRRRRPPPPTAYHAPPPPGAPVGQPAALPGVAPQGAPNAMSLADMAAAVAEFQQFRQFMQMRGALPPQS